MLDAVIEACFDSIEHTALRGRVRARVADKRVLLLVKSFPKAGVMSETGHREDNPTGTPQGALCTAEHKPPCGVPVTGRRTRPSSITPARRIARSNLRTDWSQTRSSIACINFSCGIAEKQLAIVRLERRLQHDLQCSSRDPVTN
nr:RNA-directed DNA polymerase domain protein [Rhodococcus sp. JVH1]